MSVNVAGLFTLTRDLAPMLIASATRDRPSTVVNIGSVMGTVDAIRERLGLFRLEGRRASPDPHPRRRACREAGDCERASRRGRFRPT